MTITRTAMVDDDGSGTTGTIINNAWKQEFYDQIDGALGILQSYAPAWTSAAGAAPVLGTGTITGRYFISGALVWVNITLIWGSTTTGGGGGWVFSLPVPMGGQSQQLIMNMIVAGGGYSAVGGYPVSASSINPFVGPPGSTAVGMDATHPNVWRATDWADLVVTYRRS